MGVLGGRGAGRAGGVGGEFDVAYEPEAVEAIIAATGGYPHFIQELGRVLWNEVERSPIRRVDVESAEELVGEALDRRFFRDRFESASEAEQRYLAAMAELGDGGARTSEAARLAGYKDSTGASVVRDALLRKDLVYSPRRGVLDFTVPLFGGYVRRQHPLASFDEA